MSNMWGWISQASHSFVTRLGHKHAEDSQKLAKEDKKEQPEEENTIITLKPPPSFSRNTELFDNEASSPDLDLAIKGLEKPLRLHKKIISKKSTLVDELLKTNHITNNGERDQIEWTFDTNREMDRNALVKALRLCYGDTIRVGTTDGECCAMIVALFRLQVIGASETVEKLQELATEKAGQNVKAGVELLKAVQHYPEYTNTQLSMFDKQLSEVVFSKERIHDDYETVVDDCLLKLPARYLDCAKYGKPGTKWSEMSVRARYTRYHLDSLSLKEMEEITWRCKWKTLKSKQLMELKELGVLSLDKLASLYDFILRSTETDRDTWKMRAIQTRKEIDEWKNVTAGIEKEMETLQHQGEYCSSE